MFSTLLLFQLLLLCVSGKLLTMTMPDTVEIGRRSVMSWTADSSDDDQEYALSIQSADSPLLPAIFVATVAVPEDKKEGTFNLPANPLLVLGTYLLTAEPTGDRGGSSSHNDSDTIVSNPFQAVLLGLGGGGGPGGSGGPQSLSSTISPTGTDDGLSSSLSTGTDVVTPTSATAVTPSSAPDGPLSDPAAVSHTVNAGGPGHDTPITVTVTQPQVTGSAQAADATNSPAPSGASSKSKAPIILGAVLGSIIGVALLFFLCMAGLRRYNRYKRDRSEPYRDSMFVPTEDHHEVIVDDHHDDVVSTAMEKRTATLPNFGYTQTADIEKEAYGGYEAGSSYQTPMGTYQSPMGAGTLAGPMGVGAYPNAHYRPHQGFDSRYPQPNFTYQPDGQIPHTY